MNAIDKELMAKAKWILQQVVKDKLEFEYLDLSTVGGDLEWKMAACIAQQLYARRLRW
jgi:hypothetical protein